MIIENIPVNIRDLFEEITDMFKGQLLDKPVEFILAIDTHGMSVPRLHLILR